MRRVELGPRRNLRAIAALGGLSLLVSAYWQDVHHNQSIEADASMDIEVISEALDPEANDSAFVFLHGFNEPDADWLATQQGPAVRQVIDGELWSVDYGNVALSPRAIAEEIIEKAEERGIEQLSFYGYSAGGSISLPTIEHILEDEDSDLLVESIWLDSMPDGDKGIRPSQRHWRDVLMNFANFMPSSQYSTYLRHLGELGFRAGAYIHSDDPIEFLQRFFATSQRVSDAMDSDRLTSGTLLVDQVLAISNTKAEGRLSHIAELTEDSLEPVVIYLGTADPGHDDVVNDNLSGENVCNYADEAGLSCLLYEVPGAVHNDLSAAQEAYKDTIAEASESINQALASSLTNYTLGQLKDAENNPLLIKDELAVKTEAAG